MSDPTGAYGVTGAADRLSGVRAASSSTMAQRAAQSGGTRSAGARSARLGSGKVRLEIWAGVLLVLGGIALALYMGGGADTSPTTQEPPADTAPGPTNVAPTDTLLAGEVMVAFAADHGHFPPALGVGDEVRLVVTPGLDGTGEVRPLSERTIVVSVDSSSATGGERVITVRGPESIATALAGSGPVRVAIVKVGPS